MSEELNILIVEDEQVASRVLANMLFELSDKNVIQTAKDVDQAVFIVLQDAPDLVFLDIEMPDKNGFELIHELNQFKIQLPQIVVTSSYSGYAVNAIHCSVFDYLLKPITKNNLNRVIERFYKHKNLKLQTGLNASQMIGACKKIKFPNRNGYLFIDPKEIVYCIAEANYTHLFFQDNSDEIISLNLGSVEKILSNNFFIRISRSEIINKQYLLKVCRRNLKCLLKFNGSLVELALPKKSSSKYAVEL